MIDGVGEMQMGSKNPVASQRLYRWVDVVVAVVAHNIIRRPLIELDRRDLPFAQFTQLTTA